MRKTLGTAQAVMRRFAARVRADLSAEIAILYLNFCNNFLILPRKITLYGFYSIIFLLTLLWLNKVLRIIKREQRNIEFGFFYVSRDISGCFFVWEKTAT